jgi:5'-deoxynucleotidase YfbR-like HD superfamily hydrolase
MKIFLSHSSEDKTFVRKMSDILKSQGYETWLDEERIQIGKSISNEIGEALAKSDVVLVFLSKSSVQSNWVHQEWELSFFEQVNRGKVYVLPLLIEECTIPPLLRDKKYADFTNNESYETSLANLLRTLKQIDINIEESKNSNSRKRINEDGSIFEHTKEILKELENQEIILPTMGSIHIVDTLKKIKRSGKLVRLERFDNKPKIKIRNIYDHTLSVAHLADHLLPVAETGIVKNKYTELARTIAFHEFNETILGDIPSYTDLNENRRASTANPAERILRTITPEDRERIANEFIWMFLTEKQKQSFESVLSNLSQKQSNQSSLASFFKIIDKIDAIIAIWRYLHFYRGKINKISEFLKVVRNFFEYPELEKCARHNKVFSELLSVFQNRDYAKRYYENSDFLDSEIEGLNKISPSLIKKIIEDCPLFFDNTL